MWASQLIALHMQYYYDYYKPKWEKENRHSKCIKSNRKQLM